MSKGVQQVRSTSEWDSFIKKTQQGHAVVVDYFATWCGPCKMVAPMFQQLSMKYDKLTFLKVDVDELQEVAASSGIRAMPTFKIFYKGSQAEEIVGGDIPKLQQLCEKYQSISQSTSAFSGQGHKLGGSENNANGQSPQSVQNDGKFQYDELDSTKPKCRLRVRLPTGQNIDSTFNDDTQLHKVRAFLRKYYPDVKDSYTFIKPFPRENVFDENKTLSEIGVTNSVISIKY